MSKKPTLFPFVEKAEKERIKKDLRFGTLVLLGTFVIALVLALAIEKIVTFEAENDIGLTGEQQAVVAYKSDMSSDAVYVITVITKKENIDIAVVAENNLYDATDLLTVSYTYDNGYFRFYDTKQKEAWSYFFYPYE